ncbi:MAG: TetR/AcrR family transcriptional regulator [Crocinitomicaceae bacterium]|nr:TetR/AcrR family transcriptional regulator [Crocinitomicaceae bacterium]
MNSKQTDILERAGLVFMKLGIKSVTMDDVAKELGISKKTLYNHFDDKNQLVEFIIRAKINEDIAVFQKASSEALNAIDELYLHSRYVLETFKAVNPTVFYDLRKNYSAAWKIIVDHKWNFVYNQFKKNINRGIDEGIYRNDIHKEIYAKLFVSQIEMITEGDVFPSPKFRYDTVFLEIFRLHIRGIANEKGLKYFQEQILKNE